MTQRISIIVPILNEAHTIRGLLDNLCELGPDEVVLVDGGSTDGTLELVDDRARLILGPRGRGAQLNEGARHSTGEVLLFLHADVRLQPGALQQIREALADPRVLGGNFDIRFEGGDGVARFFDFVNRYRCYFGIFFGDSGIFCRREVFHRLEGYKPWPVLEDYEFARRMWRMGPVRFLREPIYVSDRRWRNGGLLRTMFSWFWIMSLYIAGVSPYRLARFYRAIR